MRSKLMLLGAALLFTFILLEAGSYWIITSSSARSDIATYRWSNVGSSFWVDNNPHFGVWHNVNSTYHHEKSCFSHQYKANSAGARDSERPVESQQQRWVALGDSFLEGFGVARHERFSNRLERTVGQSVLNFGTSGHFGSTQYYMMYKHLAEHYSHDAVLVAVLPNNDFHDDDPALSASTYRSRHRPYWVGEAPNFQLSYLGFPLPPPKQKQITLRAVAREFLNTPHILGYLLSASRAVGTAHYSGFYDFKESEWQRLQYSLTQIAELAKPRPVLVVSIPVLEDLKRYDAQPFEDGQRQPSQFSNRMTAFIHGLTLAQQPAAPTKNYKRNAQHQKNTQSTQVHYLDLLPQMHSATDDWNAYYIPCDGHWSAYGHQVAARIMAPQLNALTRDEVSYAAHRPQ